MHDFLSKTQIHRLPPEVLEIIFILCARDYHKKNPFCIGVADWVNVSYVCHDWRNIALNCSVLWAYHFTASLRWTEEILVRSKQAPLKICLDFKSDATLSRSSLLEKLMNHMEHIQELKLHLPAQFLPRMLSLHPCLNILEIAVPYHTPHWSPVLFDGDTPALRTLDLSGCDVSWHSLVSSTLTSLSLCDIPASSRRDVVEFRAMLSRMQNLVVLRLRDALLDVHDLPSNALLTEIALPRLFYLAVAAPLSTTVAILSCVSIPLETHCMLDFKCKNSNEDVYATIPHLLAKKFSLTEDPVSSGPSIHSVFIDCDWITRRIAFTTLKHTTHEEWSSNIPFDVSLSWDDFVTTGREGSTISNICCSFPLTNVQSLHVKSPLFVSTFWEKILGHLRGLRHIKLSDGNMPDLVSVLSSTIHSPVKNPGQDGSDHDSRRHTFVPVLEALELECIAFSKYGLPRDAISQAAFFDALSTRGALRDRVTIIECEDLTDSSDEDYWL